MSADFDAVLLAPFGHLGLRASVLKGQEEAGEVLQEIVYLPTDVPLKVPRSALLKATAQQLEQYYQDSTASFSLPLATVGTAFQQRVWQAISAIPHGGFSTYGALAKAIRSAPRAVGQACGANRFPLIIPCHRVLSATGLGGFANHADDGFHLNVKRWLLQHEGVAVPT